MDTMRCDAKKHYADAIRLSVAIGSPLRLVQAPALCRRDVALVEHKQDLTPGQLSLL